MKTMAKIIFLFMLMPIMANAGIVKGKYTKEKKINKSYNVSGSAALEVGNMYGNIAITTWDENRTAIDVVITVSGNNEDDVNRRLNSIDVEFQASNTLVKAVTKFSNFRGRQISMEVNYTIKIPKNGTLGIRNEYGNIKLGKIYGGTNLECQYGSINIDEANSDNNKINIDYCSASRIGYIKAATLSMDYSDMTITKAGKITGAADYTQVKIGDAGDVNLSMDYGDLNIGSADKVTVSADYTNCKVGRVDSYLTIATEYGNVQVKEVALTAKQVRISSEYTTVKLGLKSGLKFSFEFAQEYGNLSGKDLLNFTQKSDKDFSAAYKGTSIGGAGNCRIAVTTQYGDIELSRV